MSQGLFFSVAFHRGLWCEELRECIQQIPFCIFLNDPEFLDKPSLINCSYLVEHEPSAFRLKCARNSGRVLPTGRCHRRKNHGAKVTVHLVRGDNDAGPCFLDLAASCWIEIHKINFETSYHSHSFISNVDSIGRSPSISKSSLASAIFLKASSHPSR